MEVDISIKTCLMRKVIFALIISVLPMLVFAQNKIDALIVINGKVSDVELNSIDPDSIESITVIKSQAGVDIYGDAAKNGVILIVTKDFVKPVKSDISKQLSRPLIILDGVKYDSLLNSIEPSEIISISVLKDKSATKVFGDEGKNGVIIVTTKRKN
jgi:TonB-dependent SusC/RagA subfamily outer membrane receptor